MRLESFGALVLADRAGEARASVAQPCAVGRMLAMR
jgi:hypothetical protein